MNGKQESVDLDGTIDCDDDAPLIVTPSANRTRGFSFGFVPFNRAFLAALNMALFLCVPLIDDEWSG